MAASQSYLNISVGGLQAYLDNRLGNNVTLLDSKNNVGSGVVNDNRMQLQLRPDLLITDITFSSRRADAVSALAYRLSVSDALVRRQQLAYDSIWSSANQREFYSESKSDSGFRQWDLEFTSRYSRLDVGLGLKTREYRVYNHDGVESYDLVPNFANVQAGSIVDYSVSYLMPYVSGALNDLRVYKALSIDLSMRLMPFARAAETETHYWRNYRASSHLTGVGYELSIASHLSLDSHTRLTVGYDLSRLLLQGKRDFEGFSFLSMDEKQDLRQWRVLVGLAFLL